MRFPEKGSPARPLFPYSASGSLADSQQATRLVTSPPQEETSPARHRPGATVARGFATLHLPRVYQGRVWLLGDMFPVPTTLNEEE
jgi:hypothetical protein